MKKVLPIILFAAIAVIMVACTSNPATNKNTSTLYEDTVGFAQFQAWKAMNERIDPNEAFATNTTVQKKSSATKSSSMNSSNFGEVHPDAKIMFSFEKFNLLFNFFRSRKIDPVLMENVFGSVRSNYSLTGQKILINNQDLARILYEYSKLIDKLDTKQKEDLNIFIKSIN